MTPKIMTAMKAERDKLSRQLAALTLRQEELENQRNVLRTNKEAIESFLAEYGSEEKPKPEPKQRKRKMLYGPTQETRNYLKGMYPNWVTSKQIESNLLESGMKYFSSLLHNMIDAGEIEKRKPIDGLMQYRLIVKYTNVEERRE